MNRENITKVRDVIAALDPKRFDMGEWCSDTPHLKTVGGSLNHCGTHACIAGWTVATLAPRTQNSAIDIRYKAAGLLGLDHDGAETLFIPPHLLDKTYPPAQAVRVLDILLETGEVDWERAIREVPA